MGTRDAYLRVLLEGKHDFWRAVPSCRDVFRHETRLRARGLGGLDRPCEAKVADLEVAVGVQEQVRGLKVAVDDVGGMQRLERAEGLVHEVLRMVVGEVLRADDAVHVGFHEFLDD